MKKIIALLLALMLLSGATALADTGFTMTAKQMEIHLVHKDIDNTYTLPYALTLSAGVNNDMLDMQMYVEDGENTLFPMALRLSKTAISLLAGITDTGITRALDETIMPIDLSATLLSSFNAIPVAYDPAIIADMYQAIISSLPAQSEQPVTITVAGTAYPCVTRVSSITNETLGAAYDAALAASPDAIKTYNTNLLGESKSFTEYMQNSKFTVSGTLTTTFTEDYAVGNAVLAINLIAVQDDEIIEFPLSGELNVFNGTSDFSITLTSSTDDDRLDLNGTFTVAEGGVIDENIKVSAFFEDMTCTADAQIRLGATASDGSRGIYTAFSVNIPIDDVGIISSSFVLDGGIAADGQTSANVAVNFDKKAETEQDSVSLSFSTDVTVLPEALSSSPLDTAVLLNSDTADSEEISTLSDNINTAMESDLMTFLTNESVLQLIQDIATMIQPVEVPAVSTDNETEEPDVPADLVFESFAQAQSSVSFHLPDMTAFENAFKCEISTYFGDSLSVDFEKEDGDLYGWINMYSDDSGTLTTYTLDEDGKPVAGGNVAISMYTDDNDGSYKLQFETSDSVIYLYAYDATLEDMENIIAMFGF